MSEILDTIPLPSIYYHPKDASYWCLDNAERWIKINETNARNYITQHGYTKTAISKGGNSEVDRCLLEVQSKQNVAYVGPLAGYHAGVYTMSGNRILVTDSPRFIVPAAGEWSTLDALFRGMFVDGQLDQQPYFFSWLKCALEAYRQGRWKASQLLALAGPVNSGKSLTQNLITVMLGGRSAKPYKYRMGLTQFNSHMIGAEHLMLEDEVESMDILSGRHFAAKIKTILPIREQDCHLKFKEAIIPQPFWRMTMSLSDGMEGLQLIARLDACVRDKIMILKARKAEMPMPTDTPELEKTFWYQLTSEIPAFLHFLQSYQIPTDITDARYGVTAFKHPVLLDTAEEEQRSYNATSKKLYRFIVRSDGRGQTQV